MAKKKATYVDVRVELIRSVGRSAISLPEFSVHYQFKDWDSGHLLNAHEGGLSSEEARQRVTHAIKLWGLRKVAGLDQWRNAPSPGFRRAIGRVRGRARRTKEERRHGQ